jgi:hypothetical protein
LIAANIYLLVGISLRLFPVEEVAQTFPHKSSYLFNDSMFFNQVFKDFVQVYLDITLEELLPFIQFSAKLYWTELQPGHLKRAKKANTSTEELQAEQIFSDLRAVIHKHDLFSPLRNYSAK